jgi:hypothetical protein
LILLPCDPVLQAVARRRALAAIAAVVPGVAGPALALEAFSSGRCDAGQRLEVGLLYKLNPV